MNSSPRSPALARLVQSTVRVGNGSGVAVRNGEVRVIVTARHVIPKGQTTVTIRHAHQVFTASVLSESDDDDLAVLSDDPQLAVQSLDLPPEGITPAPGDSVTLAGFPGGWPSAVPLLGSGMIAGEYSDSVLWVNADATWGNSGGPVCLVVNDTPYLAGVVLGFAGAFRGDLDSLVSKLTDSAAQLGAAASVGGSGFAVGTAMGTIGFGTIADVSGRSLKALAEFARSHFRTGFTRAASLSAIKNLL